MLADIVLLLFYAISIMSFGALFILDLLYSRSGALPWEKWANKNTCYIRSGPDGPPPG